MIDLYAIGAEKEGTTYYWRIYRLCRNSRYRLYWSELSGLDLSRLTKSKTSLTFISTKEDSISEAREYYGLGHNAYLGIFDYSHTLREVPFNEKDLL